ncbi:unnamed protein product [Trichogramma brassicae]|uniref:Retrotransposon gag domain-containing protein n=1 Tax=Trichogramma brassicae TaxID=86971 RepID=A0A6H5IQU4_9HYME|nr:unnamed protein product [Trichogramma brassicae]
MWDPVQDVASQMSAVTAASNNQAAVEATPLASSPNKLGNNFRHWRNMHNISESSSLMDTVIDGNAERARRVAEEESAESVAESELRDRVEDRVHTEQQRALESSNEGRSESENREEIVHSSEREEQIAPSEFERGPAAGATSTARRVAFANDANAMNKNKADRATRRRANEHRAGDATGSRGSDDARGNRGLNTGTEIGGRGRTGSREPRGTTSSRTGLRERGGSLTRYENSRYGANANGWSSVPDSTRGERRNSMSNSAWNGSLGFNSTLARERNTCDLYRQWGLVFRDAGKSNPEMFITRLMTCAGRYQLSLDDICRTLPAVLDMEACAWLEREEREWETLDDMAEAFRLQYCDEGTQQCLRQEIEARTQGPKEEISVFLLKIRLLLDQLKPPLCLSEQIDRAMWPGRRYPPRTDRVQKMAARSRTRSVTFRYSRLPGMSLQGEFPAGSVVYRQVMFRCTNNVRACYRGGRHICLTVNRPCASPYSENEETEENEEDREKEKPSDVLPGVAVMGTAAEECTAEEAMVVASWRRLPKSRTRGSEASYLLARRSRCGFRRKPLGQFFFKKKNTFTNTHSTSPRPISEVTAATSDPRFLIIAPTQYTESPLPNETFLATLLREPTCVKRSQSTDEPACASSADARICRTRPPTSLPVYHRWHCSRTSEPGFSIAAATMRAEATSVRRRSEDGRSSDQSTKGRWTHRLVPDIKEWVERRHGEMSYHLTQLLTGHGYFRHHSQRYDNNASARCPVCPDETENVEHVFFHCSRFEPEREVLQAQIGERTEPENIVRLMLRDRRCGLAEETAHYLLTACDAVADRRWKWFGEVCPSRTDINGINGLTLWTLKSKKLNGGECFSVSIPLGFSC